MKSILLLVTELDSANGICVKQIMNTLVKKNIKVFCITNKTPLLPYRFEENGIHYFCVKPRVVYRITKYIESFKGSNTVKRILKTICFLLNKIKLTLSVFSWPLISPLYSRRIYKLEKEICEKFEIDAVVPVYSQVDTLIASHRLKSEKDIVYIPYFLDSLSGGYGPRIFSENAVIKRGLKWEKRLLDTADIIIAMQSSKEHHLKYSRNKAYFDKFVFSDLPLFAAEKSQKGDTSLLASGKTNLLYIGTIPAHIRNPKYLLELFSKIKDDSLHLTFIGTNTCPELMKEACARDSRISVLPFVSHEKAKATVAAADILINLGNNQSNMTPSKVFEYMATGKPIISTAPIDDEPSKKYLCKYENAIVIDENNDISEETEKVKRFIEASKGKVLDYNKLDEEFYLNTPEAFWDIIKKF